MQFSINAGVEWKGLDFSIVFQGAGKRTVWREKSTWRIPMRTTYQNGSNQFIGNTWTPENTGAYYPALTNKSELNNYNYQCSSWSVEDGSYLRLNTLTLGYTLPKSMLQKAGISNLRVYGSIYNVFTITGYSGIDAEVSTSTSTKTYPQLGMDWGTYPRARSFVLGVNLSF